MKTIIALHGNPGHPDDWNILKNYLGNDYHFLALSSYNKNWLNVVRSGPNKKILIGHSWGCYQILKNIKQIENHVEKIILCSPYVEFERKISGLASLLLKTPFLGDILIKSNHKKSIDKFYHDLISPYRENDLPYFSEIKKRLIDWHTWKTTVCAKLDSQSYAISSDDQSKVSGYALFGEQDAISNNIIQEKALQLFPNIKSLKITNAGHEIIWTQTQKIKELIETKEAFNMSEEKIGYYSGNHEKNNVITYMEQHLRDFPDRIALRWANQESLAQWNGDHNTPIKHDEINYRNFSARINSFAQGLLDIGLKKGDRIIIFLPMSLDMYTAMFAVQRIGAIAVFLDSWARSSHLGASAECVSPKAMISFKMAFDLVAQVPEFNSMPIRILYGPGDQFTHKFSDLLKPTPSKIESVESEFTALITFTTGSTGKPKGANRTHRFLSAQHHALSHVIPYTAKDCDMPAFPIFSLNNLASGVTTVLPALNLAAPSAKDSAMLATQILHENINCTTLSPSMLVGLAKYCAEKNIILKNLRRVVTGGAPISKDDVRAFYKIAPQTELWILYGSTEAEPMAHIEGRDMLKESTASDSELVEEGVNVGHISEDIDFKFIKIKDGPIDLSKSSWTEIEVQNGSVGEFICSGDHVCRDYYNNPDAFKTTKIMEQNGKVWHRTGDLAFIDKDKNLWIVGRVNNVVERSGQYLFPVRAEILLKRMPFSYRCAFLGVEDKSLGQSANAVIELKQDIDKNSFDFAKAKKEIQNVFNKNKIPVDHIYFVHAIPMDPRHFSKVEYKVLREKLKESGVIIG